MRWYVAMIMVFAGAAVVMAGNPKGFNYDESRVGAYTLPALLVRGDGTTVTTAAQWREKRRPEILDLFRSHVYGRTPAVPGGLKFEEVSVKKDALGGLATRRIVRISLEQRPQWKGIEMMLYCPNAAKTPSPVFIGLSFKGNHAVTTETDVLLSTRWMRGDEKDGIVDHRATEAARGRESSRWPLELILGRGYAVATAYYGDIEPDHADGWKEGLRAALGDAGPQTQWKADDWGAIGAWSWGLSRMLDCCGKDPRIDAGRAAVIGHSRLGKTALWTGAQDERFAVVISNNSGEGGAALTRREFGENTARITTSFPHWFCPRYASYSGRAKDLPVDQHMLIALAAPRPVYIASASGDLWADPRGEFLSGRHAGEVYALFGRTGLGVDEWPAPGKPVGGSIGYHLRDGKHDITAYDWERYLDFADRHYGR